MNNNSMIIKKSNIEDRAQNFIKACLLMLFMGVALLNSNNAVAQELEPPTVVLFVSTPTIIGDSTIFNAYIRPEFNAASYNFHLGNGEETGWSKNSRISYVYNSTGQYEAFVEVRPNPDLNSTNRSKPVTVEVIIPLEADLFLRADKTDVFVDETIQFTGGASITGGALNDSLDLIIDYGDDGNARYRDGDAGNFDGPTVEYSYSQPGSYRVQLSALGRQVMDSEAITINVGVPSLSLNTGESLVEAGSPVLFTSRLEPSRPEFTYEVNFGDNTTNTFGAGQQIEHRYPDPGRYQVYAIARSPNGEIAIRSDSITVQAVEVSLAADKSVIREGESIRFTGSVNPAVDNATYNFVVDDSTFSRPQPTFEYLFRQAGEHEVNLMASVDGRSFSGSPHSITVRPGLNLSLKTDASEAETGASIQFTATGIPPDAAAEYNFHFGDGEESGWTTKSEAIYSYDQKGSYDAFVEARLSPDQVFQSTNVPINIDGFPYWILIAAALVILGIGSYLLASGSIPGLKKGAPAAVSISTTVKPYIDQGKQGVAPNSRLELASELRLKPVKDIGVQSIETTDNLII